MVLGEAPGCGFDAFRGLKNQEISYFTVHWLFSAFGAVQKILISQSLGAHRPIQRPLVDDPGSHILAVAGGVRSPGSALPIVSIFLFYVVSPCYPGPLYIDPSVPLLGVTDWS